MTENLQVDAVVIGAGISGLLAARTLQSHGFSVKVLDKGRGVGGRMATRRTDQGVFDHGAQFFTVRDRRFGALVEAWRDAGVVQSWANGFALPDGSSKKQDLTRYRGVSGMTAVPKYLAQDLDLQLGAKAFSIRSEADGWSVSTEAGESIRSRALILTPPVPQSLQLLAAGEVTLPVQVRSGLEQIDYAPCLALLVDLPQASRIPEPGGLWLPGEPVAWMADNQRKKVSPSPGAAVTIHAGPKFSAEHWDTLEPEVTAELLTAIEPWLGSAPIQTQLHRWRYSQPLRTYPHRCLTLTDPAPLVFAGDAFGGPRVEGAALSGLAAGDKLAEVLKRKKRPLGPSRAERRAGAVWGSLIADALAMPVHWYYDRDAMLRDYGEVRNYVAPHNPHPDSILWRSAYEAPNERGDILHDQARYWGQRGVHYHQFLQAGENTLNLQLARVLIESLLERACYDPEDYLRRYIDFILTPGRHRDTYVEECHRLFFSAYARGTSPRKCGGRDIHIGGLAHIGVLCAFLSNDLASARAAVREQVQLTHSAPEVLHAADTLTQILHAVLNGAALREAIIAHGSDWFSRRRAEQWSREPDESVIGRRLSPACYITDAFPASLYLAWKYSDDFQAGVLANTNLGGDNCHRGAVVGALLGAAAGEGRIPAKFREGLRNGAVLQSQTTRLGEIMLA